ncbi:alpha/beta hydrolase [Kitasatospora sp. NPDC092039]|uniref:alpha/beta hydrolase n=1 Tax=Kitasatospora sp. NPDC092039 TaxID=3364086 RepID=UPI003807BF4C
MSDAISATDAVNAADTADTADAATAAQPPEPDFSAISAEELIAYREAENRFRASAAARVATGEPAAGVAIRWERVALPGRELPVRVYRPSAEDGRTDAGRAALPLVLHVHGGAFVGTAPQSDWINSHVSAGLGAVVVSVEHRLLDHTTPLSAAVEDGWDTLRHVLRDAGRWGVDPARTALLGESCGGLVCALAAIRAGETGLPLRAQVLVNPAVDVTASAFAYPSAAEFGEATRAMPKLELFRRLAVPAGTDARALSPLYADGLDGLAPALVVVPTHDAVADHGRRYAERLRSAGVPVRLTEYPGAPHAFLSLPGLVPQAAAARTEIIGFLRSALGPGPAGVTVR